MKNVAYCNPFVPPEWIAAHDLRPSWLQLRSAEQKPLVRTSRGVCPYAGAVVDAVLAGLDATALVLSTSCDQMRFAAAFLERHSDLPIFLLNVPSTWQTSAVGDLYREELARLGRFLVRLGGEPPPAQRLARVMLDYDLARGRLQAARVHLTARQLVRALAQVRGDGQLTLPLSADLATRTASIPLALLGGPLGEEDGEILDLVEQLGGRVVLDASEGGLRTLPARFDPQRVSESPLRELAAAYFNAIPDVFRRPNDGLYQWLGQQLTACQVRGILFRRYVWCDLWHAELARLRSWSPVPVLEIDVSCDDHGRPARTWGRVEAFLETLR